jgi:hypothetical protein
LWSVLMLIMFVDARSYTRIVLLFGRVSHTPPVALSLTHVLPSLSLSLSRARTRR